MVNPYRVGIELAMSSNHAAVLGALSRSLLGVYPLVNQLTAHFDRLKLAIGGALGVAAGVELLSGLGHLIERTKDLSHELTQLRKMGLSEPEIARVREEAVRLTRTVPGLTEIQALKIPGQTYAMLGLDNSLKVAESLAKFQSVIRNTTGKFDESDEKQLYQMLRSADLIGKLTDPKTHEVDIATLQKYLDVGAQVMLSTHGQVTPQTWLGMAQQGGPALMNLSDEGLRTMGIMAQVMGGPRSGTAMMSLFQQMAGGTMFKRTAEGMADIGLLGPSAGKVEGKVPAGSDWGTSGGRVVLSEEASKRLTGMLGGDPLKFAETMKRLLEEKGYTSNEEQTRMLFRILGRQTSQRFMADEIRNIQQMEGERGRVAGSQGIDAAMSTAMKGDVAQNLRNLSAAWKNLLLAVAEPNSENTITMLNALSGAINSVTETVRGMDPSTVTMITAGIAGLGAAFVGAGAVALLAAIGPAGWLIGGIIGLGAALATLKASGALDTFDQSVVKGIEERHKAIMDFISGWGTAITDAIMSALNKALAAIRSFLPSWMGGTPTGTGPLGTTGMPSNPAANRKLMEDLGGGLPGGTVAGPTGLLQKPGAWQSVPSTGAFPGGVPPSSGGGAGGPAFSPISYQPNEQRSGLDSGALRAAVSGAGGQQTQPMPINLSLNIDGRKIAESISAALAQLMEFPNQAPYHDSFGGYAPPDQQFSST